MARDRSAKMRIGANSVCHNSSGLPRPLGAVEKTKAMSAWSHSAHGLAASDLRILSVLLDRQNADNGRLDPGVTTLMLDTGLSRRSVEYSLSKLQKVGAIYRNPAPGPSMRKWIIQRPTDKQSHLQAEKTNGNHSYPHDPQGPAESTASACGSEPQAPAVIKEKKKEKKRTAARRHFQIGVGEKTEVDPRKEMRQRQEFERKIKERFERNGLCYEDLLDVPIDVFEELQQRWVRREVTEPEAFLAMIQCLQKKPV